MALSGVKPGSSVCGSHEVQDTVVSLVAQLHGGHTNLFAKLLPLILRHIRTAIHRTAVAKDDAALMSATRQRDKRLLQRQHQLEQCCLKLVLLQTIQVGE